MQGQNGGHRYPNGLTSKTFHNLVLEELSPWIEKDIGNGVMQKLMRFTAGPVHDIHLSAPATIVHLYHEKCQDVRKSVELAFHATYLPGFCHFYHLGWNNLDNLVAASSPSFKMFELAKEKFKDVPFGDF
jgi:hypothetical protein